MKILQSDLIRFGSMEFFFFPQSVDKSGNKIVVEPSPTKAVVKKVIGSIVCAYIFMNWVTVYPIKRLSGELTYTIQLIRSNPFFFKSKKSNIKFFVSSTLGLDFAFLNCRERVYREHNILVQNMVYDDVNDHNSF